MTSSMWRFICALVYIAAVAESSIKNLFINLVEGNKVNLGSYDGRVQIGTLPSLYNLTIEEDTRNAKLAQGLELLRNFFPTGILTIPPLDPYKSNKVHVFKITVANFTLNINGKIKILEVLINGAKYFNIKSLQIRMKNKPRVDFDLEVPLLHGHVTFQANLRVSGIVPIKIRGKLIFKIKGLNVKGAVSAVETSHEGKDVYQLKNLHVNTHADEVNVTLKGLGRSLAQDISRFLDINNFENASIIESIKKLVNKYVAKRVLEVLNTILKGFSVNQIKTFLNCTDNL